MKKIAIFGAGGFGREVHSLIEHINNVSNTWEFIGYFDDDKDKYGKTINGYKVLGGTSSLNNIQEKLYVVFAIAEPKIKKKVIEGIHNTNIKYPILKHPSVILGNKLYSEIGEGTILCANVISTVNIKIGKHVILNLACTVGHDTIIGDYCSFMPTVNISGEVVIEEAVYVGTGAKMINKLKVGKNTIVGSGAVVVSDLPPNCTAVGVPAKVIKIIE
ncbi:MAG: acetyltransferase [Bacteroidales bacterium]|nr:acetyltransferase [Bacteroidales bacterium]